MTTASWHADLMRVYLPTSLPMLRAWAAAGEVGPLPLTGFAVTPGLREWYASADDEELEYAATARAARSSLRLIPVSEPRRAVLVVVLDGQSVTVRDDLTEGAVQLQAVVGWGQVACAFVDDSDAEPAVGEALGAIDAADLEDPDAEFVVSTAEDHELQWFATQEIATL